MDDLFDSSENLEDSVPDVTEAPSIEQLSHQDFSSGLNQSLGIQEEAESKPVPTEQPKETTKQLIAGMSEDELKDVLNKARQVDDLNARLMKTHDTAFGRIGQLEHQLKELINRNQSQSQPTQLTKDSFSKLAAYMEDDDFTAALAEDLSHLQLGGQQSAPSVDMEQINQLVNERLLEFANSFDSIHDTTSKDFEKKLLTIQHPDWMDIIQGDEYGAWKNTLNDNAKQALDNSWDAALLGSAFTKFKQWRDKKSELAEKKKQRLEDAITPKGGSVGQSANTDDFNAGLKKVLRR